MEKFLEVGYKFPAVPALVIDRVATLRFKDKHSDGCPQQFIIAILFSLAVVCCLRQLFLKVWKITANNFA